MDCLKLIQQSYCNIALLLKSILKIEFIFLKLQGVIFNSNLRKNNYKRKNNSGLIRNLFTTNSIYTSQYIGPMFNIILFFDQT